MGREGPSAICAGDGGLVELEEGFFHAGWWARLGCVDALAAREGDKGVRKEVVGLDDGEFCRGLAFVAIDGGGSAVTRDKGEY